MRGGWRNKLVLTHLVLVLAGCGSGGGGAEDDAVGTPASAAPTSTPVQGMAAKGPLRNATINRYSIDNLGQKNSGIAASVSTDNAGNFGLPSTVPVPSLVESCGGSFVDESDTTAPFREVTFPACNTAGLSGILPANQTTVAITPLSQAIYEKSLAETQTPGNFAQVFARNRVNFTAAFGFDPVGDLPTNPLSPTGSTAQQQYAMVLGGLAVAIDSIAISVGMPQPDYNLIQLVIDDLSDGVLDGKKAGVALPIGCLGRACLPDVDLDQAIRVFRNNNASAYTGIPPVVVNESAAGLSAQNAAPVANNDNAVTGEDTGISINVLANDSDLEDGIPGGPLSAGAPAPSGTAVVNPDRTITYTPAANFNGTAAFNYTVADSEGVTASATVSINVTNVNDVPLISDVVNQTINEDSATAPLAFSVSDVETPAASLGVTASSTNIALIPVANIVIGGTGGSRTVMVTPLANQNGSATITLTVSDGSGGTAQDTFVVTVLAVNDVPIAGNDTGSVSEDNAVVIPILVNDTDVDGTVNPATVMIQQFPLNGSLSVNSTTGDATYTPAANYFGPDSFKYVVSDNNSALSNQATVSITVNSVNDNPVADNDSASTNENTLVNIPVLNGDTDVDGTLNPTTVVIVTAPRPAATAAPLPDGTVNYTPPTGYSGADSFQYTVKDDQGGTSNIATVSITIADANSPPVTNNDVYRVARGCTLRVPAPGVLGNDTDTEDGQPTLTILGTPPARATSFNLNANGSFLYVHDGSTPNADSFDYTARDSGGSDSTGAAVVNIAVDDVSCVELASTFVDGKQDDNQSKNAAPSPFDPVSLNDAQYAVFESSSTFDGVLPFTGVQHVFRKDLITGDIKLVSKSAADQHAAMGSNFSPLIEYTGRYVFFLSDSDNLGFDDGANNGTQVVRKDMAGSGAVTLVSRSLADANVGGNSSSDAVTLTPNGRYATFQSNSDNLVVGVTGSNIFRADLISGTPVIEHVGDQGNFTDSHFTAISARGRYVLFTTDLDLDFRDTNGFGDVYRRDMDCPIGVDDGCVEFTWVSTNSDYVPVDGDSQLTSAQSLSADGRFALFFSSSNDFDPTGSLYVKDLQTNALARVSTKADGSAQSVTAPQGGSISADGLSVSFRYRGTDLDTSDSGVHYNIYVKELPALLAVGNASGAIRSFSKGFPAAVDVNGESRRPVLSSTGEYVFFDSSSNNHTPIDTNGFTTDVFYGANPGVTDTDGDGLSDRKETQLGIAPGMIDSDADNLEDGEEFYVVGTDPNNPDTDGDGTPDDLDPEPLKNNTGDVAGNTALQAYRVEDADAETYDLYAVDPGNPGAEPEQLDFGIPFTHGDEFGQVETGSYDGGQRRLLNTQYGFITYVKGSRVFRVDLRSGMSHVPQQVSNLANVCALGAKHIDAAITFNTLLAVETGADCNNPDGEVLIALGADASTGPVATIPSQYNDDPELLNDYSTGALEGFLVLDKTACASVEGPGEADAYIFRTNRNLVAQTGPLTTFDCTQGFQPEHDMEEIFLGTAQPLFYFVRAEANVDDTIAYFLMRYSRADDSVIQIQQLSGASDGQIPSAYDLTNFYYGDDDRQIRSVSHSGALPLTIYTEPAAEVGGAFLENIEVTANRLVFERQDGLGRTLTLSSILKTGETMADPRLNYSLPTGLGPTEVEETATNADKLFVVSEYNDTYYAQIFDDESATAINSATGGDFVTFVPGTTVDAQSDIYEAGSGQAIRSRPASSFRTRFEVLDAQTGTVLRDLGTITDVKESEADSFGSRLLLEVLRDVDGESDDIYFADTNQTGSLIPIATSLSSNERLFKEGDEDDSGDPDSDSDGLSDDEEINIHGTDPFDSDTDDDDLGDGDEVNIYDTDPTDTDTDNDGLADGYEVDNGLDPLNGNACAAPPSDLVAWYPGDGDARDIYGANHGSLRGNASFGSGAVGRAFSFDGAGDYVEVADNAAVSVTGSLTVDAWVNPQTYPGYVGPLISKWNDIGVSNRSYVLLMLPDGKVEFYVSGDGSAFSKVTSNVPLSRNTYTHVAGVFDSAGATLTLYFNGEPAGLATGIGQTTIYDTTEPLLVGAGDAGSGVREYSHALIDEAEIFNRALSQSEIQSIYNAGNTGKCLAPLSYLQASDSPFLSFINLFDLQNGSVRVENFEDGLANTPGVDLSGNGPGIRGPSSATDSVDGDNGPVDGSGTSGYEYASCNGGVFASFDPPYPTMAGFVWTDGDNPVSFEAYDATFNQIANVVASHGDGLGNGGTAEDRFYGLRYLGGISEIRIFSPFTNCTVIDHVQFGREPS